MVTDRKSRPATTIASHAQHCYETRKVGMSAEQEEMLERQEEEFQEAFDASEEDVFGHGVAWDEEENVAGEEQERNKPLTKLQALERMTKRLGHEDDGKTGMDTWHSTWFKSRTRPLSGASEYMEYGTTAKSGNWNSEMEPGLSGGSTRRGTWRFEKSGEQVQSLRQC